MQKLERFCAFCETAINEAKKQKKKKKWKQCAHCRRQWYCSFQCQKQDWSRAHSISCQSYELSLNFYFPALVQAFDSHARPTIQGRTGATHFPISILTIIYEYAKSNLCSLSHLATVDSRSRNEDARFAMPILKIMNTPRKGFSTWQTTQTNIKGTGILRCNFEEFESCPSNCVFEIREEKVSDKKSCVYITCSCISLEKPDDFSESLFAYPFSNSVVLSKTKKIQKTKSDKKLVVQRDLEPRWINQISLTDWNVFHSGNPIERSKLRLRLVNFNNLSPIFIENNVSAPGPAANSKSNPHMNLFNFLATNKKGDLFFLQCSPSQKSRPQPLILTNFHKCVENETETKIDIFSLSACANNQKCYGVAANSGADAVGIFHFEWTWSSQGKPQVGSFQIVFKKEENKTKWITQITFEGSVYFAILKKDSQPTEFRQTDCLTGETKSIALLGNTSLNEDVCFLLFPNYVLFFVLSSSLPFQGRILLFDRGEDFDFDVDSGETQRTDPSLLASPSSQIIFLDEKKEREKGSKKSSEFTRQKFKEKLIPVYPNVAQFLEPLEELPICRILRRNPFRKVGWTPERAFEGMPLESVRAFFQSVPYFSCNLRIAEMLDFNLEDLCPDRRAWLSLYKLLRKAIKIQKNVALIKWYAEISKSVNNHCGMGAVLQLVPYSADLELIQWALEKMFTKNPAERPFHLNFFQVLEAAIDQVNSLKELQAIRYHSKCEDDAFTNHEMLALTAAEYGFFNIVKLANIERTFVAPHLAYALLSNGIQGFRFFLQEYHSMPCFNGVNFLYGVFQNFPNCYKIKSFIYDTDQEYLKLALSQGYDLFFVFSASKCCPIWHIFNVGWVSQYHWIAEAPIGCRYSVLISALKKGRFSVVYFLLSGRCSRGLRLLEFNHSSFGSVSWRVGKKLFDFKTKITRKGQEDEENIIRKHLRIDDADDNFVLVMDPNFPESIVFLLIHQQFSIQAQNQFQPKNSETTKALETMFLLVENKVKKEEEIIRYVETRDSSLRMTIGPEEEVDEKKMEKITLLRRLVESETETITWPDTKETIQVSASQVPVHIQAVAAPGICVEPE